MQRGCEQRVPEGVAAVLEECRGKWRVVLDPDVEELFKRRGLYEELRGWRRGLEEDLNRDPGAALRLLREPVIRRIKGVNVRRYRLYLSGKGFRLLFIVNARDCVVIFIAADKRDEDTYRRLKRRLRG